MTSETILLPVIASPRETGWPNGHKPQPVRYLDTATLFGEEYATDAHFCAYSIPSVPYRMTLDAIGLAEVNEHGWPMVLFVVDVDGPSHKSTPAWWADECAKLEVLEAHCPGLFVYATRGGYRIVFRLEQPFVIRTFDDKDAWRDFYQRSLLHLVRSFGIVGDPVCADITRLYRLPHATRDKGGSPERLETKGSPAELPVWSYHPDPDDTDDDLRTLRTLSGLVGAWQPVLRRMLPPDQRPGADRRNDPFEDNSKDENRVLDRARKYLAKKDPSLQGSNGNRALWCAAEDMAVGFALGSRTAAELLLADFNPRCVPPWKREEIEKVLRDIERKAAHPVGYLRDRQRPKAHDTRSTSTEARRAKPPAPPVDDDGDPDEGDDDGEEEPTGASGPSSKGWMQDLQWGRDGYRCNTHNIALVLRNTPGWEGCIVWDDFLAKLVLTRCPPSHEGLPGQDFPREWSDTDTVLVLGWVQKRYQIDASVEKTDQAALMVAMSQRQHPIRSYLEGLTWDGVPRLATWLTTYLGAKDSAYGRAIGPATLRAAVARVLMPGCKVDTMTVLQGDQGAFKSTAIRVLCGATWFTDELADFGSKDAAMQLAGKWVIEVGELAGMGRSETEHVKSFVSRAVDRFRASYGRHVKEQPRQCVFIGTTNADTYLRDETGNRRFWPVQVGVVGPIDLEGLARDRDQLWAEAHAEVKAGARWYLDKKKDALAIREATHAQEAMRERDVWEKPIRDYLARKVGPERKVRDFVTTTEVLADLGVEVAKQTTGDQRRVGATLRGLKWRRGQRGSAETRDWGYYRTSESEVPLETATEPADPPSIGVSPTAVFGSDTDVALSPMVFATPLGKEDQDPLGLSFPKVTNPSVSVVSWCVEPKTAAQTFTDGDTDKSIGVDSARHSPGSQVSFLDMTYTGDEVGWVQRMRSVGRTENDIALIIANDRATREKGSG